MLGVLVVLLVVVPVAELAVIVQASQAIGLLNTLALLVLVGLAGAWLVKREGLGVLRRVRTQLERGQPPARELLDGLLIVVAGAMMLAPGFLTDVVGLALLLPPVRAVVRAALGRHFQVAGAAHIVTVPGAGGRGRPVVDAESSEGTPPSGRLGR